MFRVESITSFEDPRLLPYRNMRRQYDHVQQEIFVAEGEKIVRRLLESDIEIISLLFPQRWLAEYEPLLQQRREDIAVFIAEIPLLEKLTGFPMYQGVLGVARIPPPSTLDEIIARSRAPRFFLAMDGLSNSENVGVLVRNGVAFGAQAIIVAETCATPYLRRAVRNSMGTIFKIPYVQTPNLAETIQHLRSKNIRCVAAHPHTDRKNIFETDFSSDCCVVLGAEGTGISEAVRNACDECVAIPMHNEVDSLNVGSAGAIFLYEVTRQRTKS